MRRWFAILMLFILPIRGLVGDAMAYSMLPMQLQTPTPVVTPALAKVSGFTSLKMMAMEHLQSMGMGMDSEAANSKLPCHDANDASQEGDTADAQQCTSCQVCHLALTYPVQATTSLPQTATAAPLQHASAFHSADLRLSVKPPVL
jgi:hypothetical protein